MNDHIEIVNERAVIDPEEEITYHSLALEVKACAKKLKVPDVDILMRMAELVHSGAV